MISRYYLDLTKEDVAKSFYTYLNKHVILDYRLAIIS